ncbi:MAG: hypothetical protein ABI432_10925 [Flavobacteriales bacterium]
MRIAALALATSLITFSHAQQVDWLTSAPVTFTSNPSMTDQVLTSAPGYLVGMRQLSGAFIFGQNVYGEALLERIDPVNGAQMWSCSLFDSVNVESAAVSADGMAYFAGSFMGAMGLCDGSILGGVPGAPVWNENLFLIAVDLNDGTIQWTRNLSLTYGQATMNTSLAIDPNGNLWYTIEEWGVGRVVRVDVNGADVETRTIDGVRTFGTISFDASGGLYVSGSADDSGFAFGGQSYQNYGITGYTMFVLRYRPDGTAGFIEFAEDATFQSPTVVATSDGHAYLAGNLMIGTNWGGIPFNGPDWVYAVFLTELDSTGQFLWGVESDPAGGGITGDVTRAKGPCIAVDASDNVYLMGTLRGIVDWGSGVVSTGIIGDQTMTIVAFTPSGTPQWAATSQPTGSFSEARTLTAEAEAGTVHFAGHITADFTFPPQSTNTGGAQAAMVGRLDGLSTGTHDVVMEQGLALWPSPATDMLSIEFDGTVMRPAVLLNNAGQVVLSLVLAPGRNTLDVGALSAGLYLLRTADGRSLRVVKE